MKTASTSTPAGTAVAVIANAKPGKEPKKTAPRKVSAKPAKTAKKAVAKETVKAVVSGTPLKAFAHLYGLTPKQARVLLRKAWRNDAGLLHSLRNRWIFSAAQRKLAGTVLKAAEKPALDSSDESEEE